MESYHFTLRYEQPKQKYPAKSHARRVAERLRTKSGLLLLHGTKSAYYNHSDQKQAFRQDRYFYYLSGCNEPDCDLTYDIASDVLTLILPPVDYRRFFYDGRGSTVEEALEKYDIDEAVYSQSSVTSGDNIYTIDTAQNGPYGLPATQLRDALDYCRAIKDDYEIELIRSANKISAAAHRDVLTRLHTIHSETEAEAVYIQRCLASGAKEQSYGPIFGAGPNASFLHYVDNDAAFDDSQLLLIDAGAEWKLYASDVTRTIPLNKRNPGYWPSEEAKSLYEAVERIQEKCIRAIANYDAPRPHESTALGDYLMATDKRGTLDFYQLNQIAVDEAQYELTQLGILEGDKEEIAKAGTVRAFFPHGLGHHMGLEVHDAPPPSAHQTTKSAPQWLSPLWQKKSPFIPEGPEDRLVDQAERNMAVAPPFRGGNVITIEPGLYFNKFFLERFVLPNKLHSKFINLDVLKRYLPVGGVRIEDDILITEVKGKLQPVNLTTAPKGEEALAIIREAAMKSM